MFQNQDNQPAILKNLLKEVCTWLQEQVGTFPFTLEALLQKEHVHVGSYFCVCKLDCNICLHAATHVAAVLLNQFVYVMFYVHMTINWYILLHI